MIGTSYLPEGELIRDTETRAYTSSLDGLKKAMREGRILEGVAVRCSGDLTLTVEVGKFTGTIERDEAVFTQGEPVKDIAIITRVGKPVCFRVLSVTERGGMPVIKLSRRLAQRECVVNYLSGLTPGDIIAAKVTHLEHFGAFVDIGCGVASLLPIDCVSVSRIDHPAERLRVGCMMPVCVKSVERENGMTRRIYVTRRELLGTWEENAALFRVGLAGRRICLSDGGCLHKEHRPRKDEDKARYRRPVQGHFTEASGFRGVLPVCAAAG